MHATQISTCARNSRRAVPPTPCRSRPPAPCRRRVGHVERCSTWTWGCGRGSTSHPRGNSVRQDTPCHATWQAPRSPTHLPRRRTGHAPHCRQNSPLRTGHGNWLATTDGTWTIPRSHHCKNCGRRRREDATRSRHRNVPRDGWYFAPPWYFGSTRPSVPRPVADPTISDTSATNVSSCARHSGTWTWRARPQQYFAPRGISVRQGTSCHTRWQTPRSLTHLPRRQTSWPKSERWRHGVEHQTPGRTHSHVGMTRQPRANQVTKQAQSRRITDGRARSTPCTRAQQQRSCPHHPPRANILAEGSQPQRASPSHVPDEITGTT